MSLISDALKKMNNRQGPVPLPQKPYGRSAEKMNGVFPKKKIFIPILGSIVVLSSILVLFLVYTRHGQSQMRGVTKRDNPLYEEIGGTSVNTGGAVSVVEGRKKDSVKEKVTLKENSETSLSKAGGGTKEVLPHENRRENARGVSLARRGRVLHRFPQGAPGKKNGISKTVSQRAKEKELLHFNEGVRSLKEGDILTAGREFTIVLQYNRKNVEALCNLSVISMKGEDLDAARAYLEEALRVSPHHVRSLLNMGVVNLRLERYSQAIHRFKDVLLVSPGNVTALVNLAMSYRKAGNWDKALSTIEEAVKSDATNPEVWYAMALVYYERGDYEGAREPFSKFITYAQEGDSRVPAVKQIISSQSTP